MNEDLIRDAKRLANFASHARWCPCTVFPRGTATECTCGCRKALKRHADLMKEVENERKMPNM